MALESNTWSMARVASDIDEDNDLDLIDCGVVNYGRRTWHEPQSR